MEVGTHEAKARFSELLRRAAFGKEVIITKYGKPIAKLVAIPPAAGKFRLASAKGEFTVPDDFNDPLPKEIEDLFWK
jgi:prevent-host-death family protein